jgi:crotonobetaine/carnitine-CoA ligase
MHALKLKGPQQRTIGNVARYQAEAIPDVKAIVTEGESYTYSELNEKANAYAAGFSALGIGHGDTVCILMDSCPEFIFVVYGLSKLGAIWVPINTDYRGEWLSMTFADSLSKTLVTDSKYLKKVEDLATTSFSTVVVRSNGGTEKLHGTKTLNFDVLENNPTAEYSNPGLNYGDTNAVTWTSGTTGRSKGVMLSHNNWIISAESSQTTSFFREGDVVYNCLPLYNAGSWTANVFRAHYAGVTLAFDGHFSVSEFWNRVRLYGATHTMSVGSMGVFLWNQLARDDDRDNTLRNAMMVPMPEDLIEPFKKRFGMDYIFSHSFGQSEAQVVLTPAVDGDLGHKPNCLGVENPWIELTLLDDEDQPVPIGEVGEVCVRPRQPYTIFNGYFNAPEATARAFRNLWYHTGDLARRDEEGDYFFADRKADFIRYGGRNVSSVQVEGVLRRHPAVADVAVFGVVSKELESEAEIAAAVKLEQGQQATPEEIARYVNNNAPYFFVPRYIDFVEDFPTTPNGKIQKYKLRAQGLSDHVWDSRSEGFKVQRD